LDAEKVLARIRKDVSIFPYIYNLYKYKPTKLSSTY
jgi:hypothetical protein